MGYLGYKPADKPLTAADITDSIITSAKIVDGTIVNADINASAAIASTKLSGSFGITEADQWRLTTSFTDDASPISTNLERVDTDGFSVLGTGMTQSSGIFTFPSTGYYLISFNVTASTPSTPGSVPYHSIEIQTTTDNLNYSSAATSLQQMVYVSPYTSYGSGHCQFFFDVTSTANCKVRFRINAFGATTTEGDSTENLTYMTFVRLGDT
jgi:hypothetical protein